MPIRTTGHDRGCYTVIRAAMAHDRGCYTVIRAAMAHGRGCYSVNQAAMAHGRTINTFVGLKVARSVAELHKFTRVVLAYSKNEWLNENLTIDWAK